MTNPFLLRTTYEIMFNEDGSIDPHYQMSLLVDDPDGSEDPMLVPLDVERLFSTDQDAIAVSVNSNLHDAVPGVTLSPIQTTLIAEHVAIQERLERMGKTFYITNRKGKV